MAELDLHPVQCSLLQHHLSKFAMGLLLAAPYPILFAFVIDSMTGITEDVGKLIAIGFILVLTQQVFEAIGCFLAQVAGVTNLAAGITFASIMSQSLVIAGEWRQQSSRTYEHPLTTCNSPPATHRPLPIVRYPPRYHATTPSSYHRTTAPLHHPLPRWVL